MAHDVLDNGICTTCRTVEASRSHFDPHQPRIPGGEHGGEWTANPLGVAKKLGKKLTHADFGKASESEDDVVARSAKRVATRWDISAKDLEALAEADDAGSWLKTVPEGERKEAFARRIIYSWGSASGQPIHTAAITAVADRLGLKYKVTESEQRPLDYIRSDPALHRATASFGEAMYASTQEWLKEHGITEVHAYRSGRGKEADDSRPFTSWTISRSGRRVEEGRVDREEDIPAWRIMSVPPTGFGTLLESEVVVLAPKSDAARSTASRSHILDNGICVDCRPHEHVLENGLCVTCRSVEAARAGHYNPREPRNPHSGEWVKTPGGGAKSAAEKFKKFIGHLEDGDNDSALDEAEKLDLPDFDALTPRQRKDLQDELETLADGKFTDPDHKARAQAVLESLGLRGPKKGKPAQKTAPKATPEVPAKPVLKEVPARPKVQPKAQSGFDEAGAARDIDALDAAPTRVRALYEAGLTPAERRKFLAEVDAMPDKEAQRFGGRGPKSTLGDDEHISIEERDRLSAAADEYMQTSYIPINQSLYEGTEPDEQTRQWIEDLDKLLSLSQVEQDSYFHRGTVLPEDLPDEMTLPGFTSLTHSTAIAQGFVSGNLFGAAAGGKGRAGVPTVMTFRVPKGTHAMQFSPQDVLGEVLLHRGAKVRRVPDDPGVPIYLQSEGIRYVTYEVIG